MTGPHIYFFLSRPYSLDHFDDYQKHFTVMNYAEGVQLKQVLLAHRCMNYVYHKGWKYTSATCRRWSLVRVLESLSLGSL